MSEGAATVSELIFEDSNAKAREQAAEDKEEATENVRCLGSDNTG